ncbi:MAG: hypothetical protein R2789_12060 [Microthrixaceae bacterium]
MGSGGRDELPAGALVAINDAPYYPIYAARGADIPIFLTARVPGPRSR